jgi:hypothetical protein
VSGTQPKGRKVGNEGKADVSGPCPFCHTQGGNITVDWGEAAQGDKPKRPGMLFHSLPYCSTYERLSGDEFIRAVIARKHLS